MTGRSNPKPACNRVERRAPPGVGSVTSTATSQSRRMAVRLCGSESTSTKWDRRLRSVSNRRTPFTGAGGGSTGFQR